MATPEVGGRGAAEAGGQGAGPAEARRGYPDVLPVRVTMEEFPRSHEDTERWAAPWGCTVTPFLSLLPTDQELPRDLPIHTPGARAGVVARCDRCGGYLSPYCAVSSTRWRCALCLKLHAISRRNHRYWQVEDVYGLPELAAQFAEFDLPLDALGVEEAATASASAAAAQPCAFRPLIHLIVVDECANVKTVESIADAIRVAIDALHDDMFVALVSFSDRLGLYNLNTTIPSVHYLPLPSTASNLPAHMVLPLWEAACRVGDCRDHIQAALLSLFDRSHIVEFDAAPPRLLESAMDTILRWVRFASPRRAKRVAHADLVADSGPGDAADDDDTATGAHAHVHVGPAPPAPPSGTEGLGEQAQDWGFVDYAGIAMTLVLTGAPLLEERPSGPDVTHPSGAHRVDMRERMACLGEWAAQLAVGVDVWGVSQSGQDSCDLDLLHPLAYSTGGWMQSVQVQDRKDFSRALTRAMVRARAFDCLLRLRFSPEFSVSHDSVTGPVLASESVPLLWRMASCDPSTTCAFGFSFHEAHQLNEQGGVQMVFAYTGVGYDWESLVHALDDSEQDSRRRGRRQEHVDAEDLCRTVPLMAYRKLRIFTILSDTRPKEPARIDRLVDLLSPHAALAIIVRQAIKEARTSRAPHAEELLLHWLEVVLAQWTIVKGGTANAALSDPAMALLAHGVFGAVCSGILDDGLAPPSSTTAPAAASAAPLSASAASGTDADTMACTQHSLLCWEEDHLAKRMVTVETSEQFTEFWRQRATAATARASHLRK